MFEYTLQLKNGKQRMLIADKWDIDHEAIIFVSAGVEIYRIANWRLLVNMKRRPI